MSKPLCFILQLVGLGFFLTNLGKAVGGDLSGILIGLGLIVVGGIGFRKRIKGTGIQTKKQESNWIN